MLRVLEKQSNHLFFGATYSWDKLDNALNHSHLPSSTKKSAKKLGVKAGAAPNCGGCALLMAAEDSGGGFCGGLVG